MTSAWGTAPSGRFTATPWPVGQYMLTQKAEMPPAPGGERRLLEAGTTVLYDGMPATHMEPLDAQAQANVAHVLATVGRPVIDPTDTLSLVLGEVENADARIAELQAQVSMLEANKKASRAAGATAPAPAPAPLTSAAAAAPVKKFNIPPPPPMFATAKAA